MKSLKVPLPPDCGGEYIELVTYIIEMSLPEYKELYHSVFKYNDRLYLEWMSDDGALLVDEETLGIIKRNVKFVKNDYYLVRDEHTKTIKHPYLDVFMSDEKSEVMDGMYFSVPKEEDKLNLKCLKWVKLCDCIERHSGYNVYHIEPKIKISSVILCKENVLSLLLCILSYNEDNNALRTMVENYSELSIDVGELTSQGTALNLDYSLTLKQALRIRGEVGKMLIIPELDRTYTVIYDKDNKIDDNDEEKDDYKTIMGWTGSKSFFTKSNAST